MSADQPSPFSIKIGFMAVGLVVFAVFTWLRGSDFGALAAFATLAVTVATYSCWSLHQQRYFWPLLTIVGAAHFAFLMGPQIKLPRPTILLAPIVIADYVAIVALLFGIDLIWPRSKD